MHKTIIALFFLSFTLSAGASEIATVPVNNTSLQNTLVGTTAVNQGQAWGLTTEEWARYQTLMQGPFGQWYPHLSPAMVLGIQATNPQEQIHFAEIVAKEEHDKLARELAFNNAVHQALLHLYSTEPIIKTFDTSPFRRLPTTTMHLQAGDHIVLFTTMKPILALTTVPKLINDIKANSLVTLDIFCVGTVSNGDIQLWAKVNNLPMELVNQGRITLNADQGEYQKIAKANALPTVLLVRGGQSHSVSLEGL